jgi:hypothetical protein
MAAQVMNRLQEASGSCVCVYGDCYLTVRLYTGGAVLRRGKGTALPCKGLVNKQTPWPLVRKRIIPTEGPPIVDEI